MIDLNETQTKNFWAKVDTKGEDDCWPWLAMTSKGYGRIQLFGKSYPATHVSLHLAGHPRPEHHHALHRCDNPPCVNPAHLFWGTNEDNQNDKIAKGRQSSPKGTDSPNAKLTEEIAREILLSHDPQTVLAKRFGVSQETISAVRRGRTWKHLGITAVRKGKAKGVATGHAKIDEKIAREIRSTEGLQREIAERFGVTQTLVSQIKLGKVWKHA